MSRQHGQKEEDGGKLGVDVVSDGGRRRTKVAKIKIVDIDEIEHLGAESSDTFDEIVRILIDKVFCETEAKSAEHTETENFCTESFDTVDEIVRILIDKVFCETEAKSAEPTPIDASKVTFACLDIRLKTGFPPPAVKKVFQKNCVSIILTGDREAVLKRLAVLESASNQVRFMQDSSVVNQQVRRDMVFWKDTGAANFCSKVSKYSLRNVSLKMITQSESDLGHCMEPVLAEEDIIYIQTLSKGVNIMSTFEGKVEVAAGNEISFTFCNLASLNLFLYTVAMPDNTSLGLLRRNMTRMKNEKQLKEVDENDILRLEVGHPLSHPHKLFRTRPVSIEKSGWKWANLENTYKFRLGSPCSKTEKVLIFKNKLDLYKFWTSETGKMMVKVGFSTFQKEKETKVMIKTDAVIEVQNRGMTEIEKKVVEQKDSSGKKAKQRKQKVRKIEFLAETPPGLSCSGGIKTDEIMADAVKEGHNRGMIEEKKVLDQKQASSKKAKQGKQKPRKSEFIAETSHGLGCSGGIENGARQPTAAGPSYEAARARQEMRQEILKMVAIVDKLADKYYNERWHRSRRFGN